MLRLVCLTVALLAPIAAPAVADEPYPTRPRSVPTNVVKILREATRQAVQAPDFKSAMANAETPIG